MSPNHLPISTPQSKSAPTAARWGSDLKAGFLVFLIALPLCLGISMASGFPPVAGILTAIIGGVLVSFIGSARLTIKGPAAGLIVIAIGAVTELGQGNAIDGYRRALAVGVAAATLQILLALLRAGTVGIAMPLSVVHGMLAAIGVIIIAKQSHVAMGVKATGKEPLELLAEIPHSILHANPEVLLLGLGSVLILLLHPRIKLGWVKQIPAQVFVLLFAVPLGLYFDMDHAHDYLVMAHHYHVGPEYLVTLPASLLDAITFPDFSMLGTLTSIKYVVMFTLVGSIESVLSTLAVDSLDPQKRASNLNRDLLATGLGNLLAASIGGLPMISEIVRSKANIDAGATSQRANFAHGVFLAVAVGAFPGILHEIPLAALAAMLVFTGARLASFRQLTHAKAIGTDQLILFMTTLVVTLATDLLVGVAAGLVLKLVLHGLRGASLSSLFSTKVEATRDGSTLNIRIHGAAAFTALLKLRKHLIGLGAETDLVRVNLTEAILVDHTFLHRLETMSSEWEHATLELVGVERLLAVSDHPHSTRRRA